MSLIQKCVNCGGRAFGHFCMVCRARLPSDISKNRPPDELLTELKRNERLKAQFMCDKHLGSLQLDVLHGIFHYDNIYRSVSELADYSFTTTTPRFTSTVWRRDVEEEIWFIYLLRSGVHVKHKVETVNCPYRNDGRQCIIEPPVQIFGYKQQFAEVVQQTKEKTAQKLREGLLQKQTEKAQREEKIPETNDNDTITAKESDTNGTA